MKRFSKTFAMLLILPVILMVGLVFTACGDEKPKEPTYLTDVTTMEFIDQVIVTEEEEKLNLIGIIFNKDIPQTNVKATYLGNEITLERTVIEDYNGDGSDVKGYQYAYSFANPPEKTTYDENPIELKVQDGTNYYKFTLTTDLIDRILGM